MFNDNFRTEELDLLLFSFEVKVPLSQQNNYSLIYFLREIMIK